MTSDKLKILVIICLGFVLFVSCDRNIIYTQYVQIPDFIWNFNNKIEFQVDVKNAKENYEVILHIRNTSNYPYSNIWITLSGFDQEHNSIFNRRYEFTLADESGRWYGKGLGDIIDNQFVAIDDMQFDKSGIYTFYVNHEMRIDNVPGIMDIGLSIRKKIKRQY